LCRVEDAGLEGNEINRWRVVGGTCPTYIRHRSSYHYSGLFSRRLLLMTQTQVGLEAAVDAIEAPASSSCYKDVVRIAMLASARLWAGPRGVAISARRPGDDDVDH
jgi:hypothetical protein